VSLLHHSPPSKGGRRLFIAIPCFGQMPAATALSLTESHAALKDAGWEVEIAILEGHCHVDDARNILVSLFLDSAADEFLFIDADLSWQAPQLVEFCQHQRDVVAGVYPRKSDDESFPCRFLPGEIWSDEAGLIEVEGVPTGMLKLSREALQSLAVAALWYGTDETEDYSTVPLIFERTLVAQDKRSEPRRFSGDLSFCNKWRAQGGKVYVDPSLYLEHIGQKRWHGSFGSYLKRINGLDLEGLEKIKHGTFERSDIFALFDEWGNRWAGGHELLCALVDIARQAKGPIIEIGTGLSSLMMAAAGAEVHALECEPGWLSKVNEARARYGLENLRITFSPMVDRWYRDYQSLPWANADIIFCDGPSRRMGDRSRLYEVMAAAGARPRCFVQDDITRLEDCPPLPEYEFEIVGRVRKFAIGRRRDGTNQFASNHGRAEARGDRQSDRDAEQRGRARRTA
jgi:hypothetical protein